MGVPAVPPLPPLLEPALLAPPLFSPPLLEPALPEPAVPVGGGLDVVQVPTVEPGSRWHRPPGQQSPLMVQLPPLGTHAPSSRQRRVPLSSGTQGTLSQQSAAEAQISPRGLHSPTPRQRGTPSASSLHISDLGVSGPQQSERADELLHS